ncbi:MAG TPA: hypothetical protein VH591_21455 [Ktedonobacterales bacterium]|jgi:hypothetical protein
MASATTTKIISKNTTPVQLRPRSAAPVATPEQRETQEKFVDNQINAEERLAQIRAEKARLREEERQLRAAPVDHLAREIARQTNTPSKDLIASLRASVRGRMAYGQGFDEAVDAILAQCRVLLEAIPEDERVRKFPTPPIARKPKAE